MQMIWTSNFKRLFSYLETEAEKLFTFLFSIAMGYGISSIITLKANNPYGISNVANQASHWNPENNYFKIVFVIIASLLIFWGLNELNRHFSQKWFRLLIVLFATASILVGSFVPTATTYSLDPFHSGEQLAPSIAYHNGKKMFSDIFTLHGAGQDVLLPNLAFTLFNHGQPSIGAYVLFTALLQTLSVFLFFTLLAFFLRSSAFFLFSVLYFLTTIYSGFGYEKNILLYVGILLVWLVINKTIKTKYYLALLGVVGFISSISILNSYDVGVMMTLASVLALVALPFLNTKNGGASYSFKVPTWKLDSFVPSFAIAGGLLTGQLFTLLFLGIKNYLLLVQTLLEITKFQGLMFDYPVADLGSNTFLFWLPIITLAISGYMFVSLVFDQYKKTKHLTSGILLACLLMFISVLYLRFGVGRPDVGHIAMAAPIILLTGFYIVSQYCGHTFASKQHVWPVALFLILLFWPQLSIEPTKIFIAGNNDLGKIKEFVKLPQKADDEWLNQEQLKVTRYIRDNSSNKDTLFIVVPEPLYYYTTNRENPSRFAISWFADPAPYTTELLHSLKQRPPKFIIKDSLESPYRIGDGVPITDRFPETEKWIDQHYKNKITIDNTIILSQ